jgi:hypothetical protein
MTETSRPILEELSEFLVLQGLTPGGGASEAEIAAFERRYDVLLPADARAYFAQVNGVVGGRDGAWDDEMIALWQLRDVRPLSEEVEHCPTPEAEQYFVFADWSIWAHGYVIRLSASSMEAPVYIAYHPQLERVTVSFDEFLRGYLRRDHRVLFGVPLAS